MKCGSQIAVAVVGGYFLGRSRKTRLAALLALLAAGGKIPIDQRELLRRTPLGAPLDKLTGDLRSQLVDAGMNVAKKAASNRIDSFSDKLQERADVLRTPRPQVGGEDDEGGEEARETPRRKGRDEPARKEPARGKRSRREAEPEEAPDEYDDYDDYEDDEYEDEDEDGRYEGEQDGDYEDDYYDEPEPEPAPEPEKPRRPSRSARPEPRRRTPSREAERPRRGRTAR